MTTRTPTWQPTLADLEAETPLTTAEQKLLDGRKTGEIVVLGPARPEAATDGTEIRGALIRYLLLGGCDAARPHPKGVRVSGAWVSGVLDFVRCRSDLALVIGNSRFAAAPQMRDCHLDGLILNGSEMPGLKAHRMIVARSVLLRIGFRASETVDLSGARIGLTLACDGGRFEAETGDTLNCNAMTVGADVFLRDGFVATGPVNLGGAQVGGQLSCTGGRFEAETGVALECDALTVAADVFLRDGFVAKGPVDLRGAQIGGQLACDGGKFEAETGDALNCDALTVAASVFLSDGFVATWPVILRRAQIGGQLACTGGRFEAETGVALDCDAMTVGADVFLRGGFVAKGPVNLIRAQVGGSLQVSEAELAGWMNCEAMTVGATFTFREVTGDILYLDLMDARVGRLRDDAESWAVATHIRLTDFRYDALDGGMSVRGRLDWLARNLNRDVMTALGNQVAAQDFDPQAYTHLAHVFDAQGHRRAAARVLYEREKRLRRAEYERAHARLDGTGEAAWNSVLAEVRRVTDFVFGLLFGYGHKPMRGLVAAAVFIVLGGWLYGAVYTAGQMAPNSDVILTSSDWVAGVVAYDACQTGCVLPLRAWEQTPSYQDYETFDRWLYGLDLFIPLDALGQEAAWAPSKDRGALGRWGYYLRWLFQMAGWVITALGAAVVTGLVGRRE